MSESASTVRARLYLHAKIAGLSLLGSLLAVVAGIATFMIVNAVRPDLMSVMAFDLIYFGVGLSVAAFIGFHINKRYSNTNESSIAGEAK